MRARVRAAQLGLEEWLGAQQAGRGEGDQGVVLAELVLQRGTCEQGGVIIREHEYRIPQRRITREQDAPRRRQRVEAEVRLGLTVLEPVRLHIGLQPELHRVAARAT